MLLSLCLVIRILLAKYFKMNPQEVYFISQTHSPFSPVFFCAMEMFHGQFKRLSLRHLHLFKKCTLCTHTCNRWGHYSKPDRSLFCGKIPVCECVCVLVLCKLHYLYHYMEFLSLSLSETIWSNIKVLHKLIVKHSHTDGYRHTHTKWQTQHYVCCWFMTPSSIGRSLGPWVKRRLIVSLSTPHPPSKRQSSCLMKNIFLF